MESIRTPFLDDQAVPEGYEPVRVEIVVRDGRVLHETVWMPVEPEPVRQEDIPY